MNPHTRASRPQARWEVVIRPNRRPVPVPLTLDLHPDLLDFAGRYAAATGAVPLPLRVLNDALETGLHSHWCRMSAAERIQGRARSEPDDNPEPPSLGDEIPLPTALATDHPIDLHRQWKVVVRAGLNPVPVLFPLHVHPDLLAFAEHYAAAHRQTLAVVLNAALAFGVRLEWDIVAEHEVRFLGLDPGPQVLPDERRDDGPV